jgi:hypothetical protein
MIGLNGPGISLNGRPNFAVVGVSISSHDEIRQLDPAIRLGWHSPGGRRWRRFPRAARSVSEHFKLVGAGVLVASPCWRIRSVIRGRRVFATRRRLPGGRTRLTPAVEAVGKFFLGKAKRCSGAVDRGAQNQIPSRVSNPAETALAPPSSLTTC